jgi:hypothetical protein
MKKVILGLALVVIIAVAGGIYYVLTNLDSLVKAAIEKYGSQATHTAVRVDKVHIDLSGGAGAIYGLTVANPKGFASPKAFSLGEVGMRINLKSLSEEPYIIEEITVRAPQVFVEINADKQVNLNELKKNLTGGTAPADTTKPTTESGSKDAPRLIIRRIVFADGLIDAKVVPLDNKEYKLKLPSLTMSNLGGSKGATPEQIAKEIISRLSDQALAEIKKRGIDDELDKLKAKGKQKVDEEKAKLKDKADSKVEQEKQQLDQKLKNLLTK